VAKNQLIQEYREPEKWNREMSQVGILSNRGSVAYFPPEYAISGEPGRMCIVLFFVLSNREVKLSGFGTAQ